MINPMTNVTQAQPVAHPTTTSTKKPNQSRPESVAGKDSVKLSKAAQAVAAALQEATETPAQTAKEAGTGDLQARRVLAREAAVKSATK
jgi:hypothetical protein